MRSNERAKSAAGGYVTVVRSRRRREWTDLGFPSSRTWKHERLQFLAIIFSVLCFLLSVCFRLDSLTPFHPVSRSVFPLVTWMIQSDRRDGRENGSSRRSRESESSRSCLWGHSVPGSPAIPSTSPSPPARTTLYSTFAPVILCSLCL